MIGFLGLLPILLGIWKLFGLLFSNEEELESAEITGLKSMLKILIVTMMNGGDNIGPYILLFSQAKVIEIAVYVIAYYILLDLGASLRSWL